MKTSLVLNKLNTHYFITTTKMKLLTLLMVFLSSWGWGQVASYSFTSSSGTYTAISGGTAHNFSASDDVNYSFTLPFTFTYNGTGYTVARPTTNGFLVLGGSAPSTTQYNPLSNGSTNFAISAFAADLSSIVRSEVIGSSPNRVYVCQWSGVGRYSSGLQADNMNFQIRLYETSNVIEIIYGGNTATSISSTVQVGLRGSSNSEFNNRTSSTNWASTTGGSANNSNVTFSSSIKPTSGLTFTWSPPVPCSGTPTAGTIASNTSQNICSGTTPAALSVTGTSSGVTGLTYQWEQSTDNATWANATGGSGATTASYTPPSFGGTTIYYRCKVTCTGSSLFDVTNTATIAPPANPTTQASSLAFTSVSYSGFTASWTNGNGNRRVVYVSDAAITDPTNNSGAAALTASTTYSGTGQKIVYDGTGTSVSVTGLALGTTYNVKVIEYTRCGSTTYDNYFNVTSGTNSSTVTTSAASSVPWSEGFATGVATFPNWLTTAGSVGSITDLSPALSSNYYYVNLYSSLTTAAITTPIIGSIPSNYRFVVKYKLADYDSPNDPPASGSGDFIVAVSTNNGTSYTDVETVSNNAVAGWQEYVLNLSAYVGQNIRIRLTGNSTSGDYYLAFDNFSVEAIPSCSTPTALIISSITNNSASLSWTAPASAPGSGYDVYYSTTNTAPTAGTTPSDNVPSGTTYAYNGLTPNTTYYSWLRSNCGASDVSLWVASASFTTQCDAISTFPWTEGFESVTTGSSVVGSSTSLPTCWNSQSSKWSSTTETTYNTAKTGTKYIRYAWSASDAFVWTPGFQLTAGVSYDFSFYAQGDGFTDWVNDVFVNTSTTAAGATQLTPSFSPSGPGSTSIQAYNLVSRTFVPTISEVYYFAIRGNESTGDPWYMAFDDFKLDKTTLTWTGATSTAWNTTTNWSPATVPTSNDNVIIPNSGITNFPVVSGLTIAAGSTMTLNSNTRLTVNGNIVNNGTLTLESGATLVQGTGNTASGTGVYNVQQALTGAGGATPSGRFWYMGSPLSGASSTAFDAAGDNRLWTYAEATQSYTEITANGIAMSPIQGHVARLGASSTINFTGGALNSGDFTNSTLTNTGTGSSRGYTLISNPYPSFLDWDLIAAGATGIATSLWYRTNDGSSMVYDTYNATGGVSTLNSGVSTNPRYIPPMQAFWVYNPTDGTTGSLTISNNMRSHQTNGGLKDATDFPAFVRLNLENDGAIDQTVLYFDNNAAAGYDNFDSDKMLVPNTAQVYTFVGNKKLAINGMKSVKANKQVPLTVEFPTAKAYSFNATEVAMFDGIVLLEDRLKKVFQDLTMNPVYDFVADAGTTSDRFVVHFQPNGGVAGIESAEDNGIAIVSNATGLVTITLSEELPAMGTIQIIDINGKVIATQAINEQTTTMNINAATGVYHVLVDSASKVARKKIVITK